MKGAGPRHAPPGLARFVHQLTHDIRNDLAAVEVFATTAGSTEDTALIRDALAEISATVAACGRRLSALSAAACSDVPPTQMVQMGVAAWIEGVRKLVERNPAAPFVSLRSEGGDHGTMRSDPASVAAIVDELLGNALRGAGGASRSPSIEMSIIVSRSSFSVQVRQRVADALTLRDARTVCSMDVRVPSMASTKHRYGFGLSCAASRAEAIGAGLTVSVGPDSADEAWFTAVLVLPLGP